jgi:hypothetical protein
VGQYYNIGDIKGAGEKMDWTFGLTMTVAGMGITFITLYLLTLLIRLLNKLFPYKEKEEKK